MSDADAPLPLPGATVITRKAQARFTFTIPGSVRVTGDPMTITLVPLTLKQDLDGNKLMEREGAWGKVKMALSQVDGRPVNWASGEVDEVIESMSPPVRELVMAAYIRIHMPPGQAVDDFLGSMATSL